jgi:hypothetical protein
MDGDTHAFSTTRDVNRPCFVIHLETTATAGATWSTPAYAVRVSRATSSAWLGEPPEGWLRCVRRLGLGLELEPIERVGGTVE